MTGAAVQNRVPVLMAAMAVSLSGRTKCLTPHAVEDCRIRAEELLGRDDPLRAAVMSFASLYEVHKADPEAVIELAKGLERDMRAAAGIVGPVHREWRDVDG